MYLLGIATIEKDVDEYAHDESPFERHQFVSGCKMNSLANHPYYEALGNMAVPTGLVIVKGPNRYSDTSITMDMVQHGGSSSVPNIIQDSVFDKLYDAVSYKKKRVFIRKIKK